ncbi:MAG: UDP-N-acetylmuramate dehydrogenase [Candidatus Binatia bacterium]
MPWLEELKRVPGLRVKTNESLGKYTSMKVGGPADYLLEAETRFALAEALRRLDRQGVPFCLLGKGSNVLISDLGIRGAVVRLGKEFTEIEWREEKIGAEVIAGAAYPVARLARETVKRGYTGLEFGEGIPASVGGALVMNAGAYGSEMERVVEKVEGLSRTGEEVHLSRADLAFSYRKTDLPPDFIVTRVWLRLARGAPEAMRRKLDELLEKRKTSQPSGLPNSGSMFQNPPGDFAGRLIEAAGLKGKKIGRAQISERHANFIVNLGGARSEDVRTLMELARSEVKTKFGVDLKPEVRMIGEWPYGDHS